MSQQLNRQGARTALAMRLFGRNGRRLAVTDSDEDISFESIVHVSSPGTSFGPVERTADLAPDHLSVEIGLPEGSPIRADIEAGHYAEARAELWRVDADDPATRLLLSTGTIGEIAIAGAAASFEFRSLAQTLASPAGRIYQKSCDAALGDARCGVDLSSSVYRTNGTVTSHAGLSLVIDAAPAFPAERLALGNLVIESGDLSGTSWPLRLARSDAAGVRITLWEALPEPAAPGTDVVLTVGCDKRFATCRDRFANAVRFKGFPHVPGVDVLAVQSRRSA